MNIMRRISRAAVEVTDEVAISRANSFSHHAEAWTQLPQPAFRFVKVETELAVKDQSHSTVNGKATASNTNRQSVQQSVGIVTEVGAPTGYAAAEVGSTVTIRAQ